MDEPARGICFKCGEERNVSARFCEHCGADLGPGQVPESVDHSPGALQTVDKYLDEHLPLKVAVLAVLVVAGWYALSQSNLFGGSEVDRDYPDRACLHYVNTVQDFNDGILTEPEMRTKMQEVLTEARGTAAEGPARGIVAALTQGDTAALEMELANMNRVCADRE